MFERQWTSSSREDVTKDFNSYLMMTHELRVLCFAVDCNELHEVSVNFMILCGHRSSRLETWCSGLLIILDILVWPQWDMVICIFIMRKAILHSLLIKYLFILLELPDRLQSSHTRDK